MPNKICEKCNQVLTDDAAFCSNCGSPQKKQELEVVDIIYKNENFSNNDKSKSFLSYTGAKILSLLVIISLLLAAFAINNINEANEKIKMQEVSIDVLSREILLLNYMNDISEGVVTDKVIIKKASLTRDVYNNVFGIIDIRPQPIYERYFLGKGKLSLSDKNTRIMLEEILSALEDFFVGSGFRVKELTITEKNYNIAKYNNGKITLIGE